MPKLKPQLLRSGSSSRNPYLFDHLPYGPWERSDVPASAAKENIGDDLCLHKNRTMSEYQEGTSATNKLSQSVPKCELYGAGVTRKSLLHFCKQYTVCGILGLTVVERFIALCSSYCELILIYVTLLRDLLPSKRLSHRVVWRAEHNSGSCTISRPLKTTSKRQASNAGPPQKPQLVFEDLKDNQLISKGSQAYV